MKIGENTYKLILLDTNALWEIVTNAKQSRKGFLQKFFAEKILYAPCFSIYNVIELMPYENIYKQFVDFFSTIPCLILYPVKSIIYEEYQKYTEGNLFQITNQVANAFAPFIDNDSYNCGKFLERLRNDKQWIPTIQQEISELPIVAHEWEKKRTEAYLLLKQMKLPTNIIDEKFYKAQERETILKDLYNWGIISSDAVNISQLPALRIMAYSHFNRIYLTKKNIQPNDVMDIAISCIIPYVDAVITEGFQANIYKKAKSFIPQLKPLEIFTLKDIGLKE